VAFVANQTLTLAERTVLVRRAAVTEVEIYQVRSRSNSAARDSITSA
jgi:hypothetical protein